jgi:hypothetical protein
MSSQITLIAVLLGTCLAFAANPTIQNMSPNTWYEVPNSKMRPVCADKSLYPGIGSSDCSAVVRKWSGGVFDSKRNRLVVWGGGHKAYGGNELYGFSLDSLKWERITNPSPPRECTAILSDGAPTSRHTYNLICYASATDKFVSTPAPGIFCPPSGFDPNTWTFDFDLKKWTNLRPGGTNPGSTHGGSAYDPLTNRVFRMGRHHGTTAGLWEYDLGQNRWQILNRKQDNLTSYMGGAVDTKRNLLVAIAGSQVIVYDIGQGNYTQQVYTTSGPAFNAPGVVYDPAADRIVASDGGSRPVYAFNMDSKTWTQKKSPPGSQSVAEGGTYGRFNYSPKENAYVLVNSVDNNVLIFKLTAGPGTSSVSMRVPTTHRVRIKTSPNPFASSTMIEVPKGAQVTVLDIRGKVISNFGMAGQDRLLRWNGKDLQGNLMAAGIYWIHARVGNRQETVKLLKIK